MNQLHISTTQHPQILVTTRTPVVLPVNMALPAQIMGIHP